MTGNMRHGMVELVLYKKSAVIREMEEIYVEGVKLKLRPPRLKQE